MSIENEIETIIDKYLNDEGYYSEYRYDENDNEFRISKEIKKYFESKNIEYAISYKEGFRSCGYDNNFLAVAWIDKGEIKLTTILLECM